MYVLHQAHWYTSPGGDRGGKVDMYHLHSGERWVTHVPNVIWGGKEDLSHVCNGGCLVTHVPSERYERRGGSLLYTQWWTLSDTCP